MLNSFYLNLYAVPQLPVGIVTLFIGIYILLQNPRSLTNISFFSVCLCTLCWFTGLTLVYSCRDEQLALRLYRSITFLGVSVISPCIYFFSVSWLGLYQKSKKIVWSGILCGFIFYIIGLFSNQSFTGMNHYFYGLNPHYGPINTVFLLFFFYYFIASFYVFFPAYFKERNAERRIQIRLIAGAFMVCYFGAFDYVPKFIYLNIYPVGFITTSFWIVVVAYAIIRYKAMDIETVVHKTMMWVSTITIALTPFIVAVFWTHDAMQKLPAIMASIAFSVFMLAFYGYLQAIIPWLDDLFQRRRSNLREQLEKFSSELVYLTDLRDLLQRFVRLMRRSLYVKELSVYLYDEKTGHYVPMIAKRLRHLKPIPKEQAFLLWLEKDAKVAGLQKLRQNPENHVMMNEIQVLFDSIRASVLMPFVVGDRLIGFAALGKRMNLRAYKHDEIQFLTRATVPMSIALSNSRQFEKVQQMSEELKDWNRELESRVEQRTRELKETQEQLIQAEKMATLGILAGGVAHEINNPLTAVLTNAQILRMTASADDKESIELIEEGAKRCQIIVQKLLNYSRTAASEVTGQKTDLNRAVKSVVAMLAYQMKQENVDIIVETENVPLIDAVQNEIEQIFTNLIVNAKDAIKKKGEAKGAIEIRTTTQNGRVYVRVRDNGKGIPKEIISRIFDPFFTTKDVGEGTGLGLSVTQGIVKRYQGKIEVVSEVGQGTTFTVSFASAMN